MTKKLKKTKLVFITLILLFLLGYVYRVNIMNITGFAVDPVVEFANENDVQLYNVAIETKNELLCDQIAFEDFKDDCFVRIAEAKKEILICDKVVDTKIKYSCYTEISKLTNDVEICKFVKDDAYWNNICYKNYAVANNNSDYCWSIEKGINNNECFYQIAVNLLDWESCKDITEESKFNKCNNVISQKSQIIEPCLQMRNTLDKDACIIRLARATRNEEYCAEIKYDTIQEDCKKIFTGEN